MSILLYSQTLLNAQLTMLQNKMLAEAHANGGLRELVPTEDKSQSVGPGTRQTGRRPLAGERLAGMPDEASTLGIASGIVGQGRTPQAVRLRIGGKVPPGLPTSAQELIVEDDQSYSAQVPSMTASRSRDRPWRSPFWEGGWRDVLPSTVEFESASRAT